MFGHYRQPARGLIVKGIECREKCRDTFRLRKGV